MLETLKERLVEIHGKQDDLERLMRIEHELLTMFITGLVPREQGTEEMKVNLLKGLIGLFKRWICGRTQRYVHHNTNYTYFKASHMKELNDDILAAVQKQIGLLKIELNEIEESLTLNK